jgi:hypothetical protein
MSNLPWVAVWALVGLGVGAGSTRAGAAAEDGVALAVVYDTSGSMNDPVRDGAGRQTSKHLIGQRALQSVVQRLQGFAAGGATGSPRRLDAGLYVFCDGKVKEFTKLAPFEARTATGWSRELPPPSGGTPLGNALQTASEALLRSPLSRKHVLVVTDGLNTVGPDPARLLPDLKRNAAEKQASLSVHFIAFDVDAKLFEPLKKQGVTVVGAADERQLNTQLEFILEKRILLEDEEPPRKN